MLARLRRQPRPRCCTPYRCRPTLRRRAMTTAIPARLIPRGPMQRPHSLPYRWRDAASPRKICRRHAWAYPRARLSRCAGLLRIDVVPPRRRHERRRAAGPYAGPLSLPAHGVHAVRPDRSGRAARLVAAHEPPPLLGTPLAGGREGRAESQPTNAGLRAGGPLLSATLTPQKLPKT